MHQRESRPGFFRRAARGTPALLLACAFLVLAVLAALAALPSPARAQGRWIDIGSGVGFTITVEGEPESRALFPPFAFGTFSPGNYVYLELLPWPCSGLPDPGICAGTTFVRAFRSYLDAGTCPCTGALFAPVTFELGYDPVLVGALGAREEDLRLALYDGDALAWVELPDQRVHPDRDLVAGSQARSARQFLAILVRPQPVSTWGRIKAQWSDSP